MKEILKNTRGAATIEMAVVLIFVVLIMGGIIDFARVMHEAVTLAGAAHAGVTYGAFDEVRSADTAGMIAAAQADAPTMTGMVVTAGRYCECGSTVVNCNDTCGGGAQPKIYVQVRTAKTFTTLINYPGVPASVDLWREAFMRAR